MDCPKCGGPGKKGFFVTNEDKTMMHLRHKPANHHQALVGLGVGVASMAAKLALSKSYKCTYCDYVWRKWF